MMALGTRTLIGKDGIEKDGMEKDGQP